MISGLSWAYKMPVAHYNNPPLVSVLMMATGLFVNGPYALITTAVSANLVSYVVSLQRPMAYLYLLKLYELFTGNASMSPW